MNNITHDEPGSADVERLPVPPARARFLVAGTVDLPWFLAAGRMGYEAIRSSLSNAGVDVGSLGCILDFGCGVGRVTRYWAAWPSLEIHGTDIDGEAIDWSAQNLPFGRFKKNGLGPPLDYPDGQFGLVYALSVFTHLPAKLQLPWFRELLRVVKPGGYLYITTHGDWYRHLLTTAELADYERDGFACKAGGQSGSNEWGAFHSLVYVQRTFIEKNPVTLLESLPRGARGNPEQDSYLIRMG